MKNNFKTNLVALLAIVSGTAFGSGNCLGMQNAASSEMAVGTGIVRPVERSHFGAFDTVVPAPDNASNFRRVELPPIVSPKQANTSVPPIVTPGQANRVPSKVAKQLPAPKFTPKRSAMLAPIAEQEPVKEIKIASIDPTMAPPAIMQASNASGDTEDDSKVSQAAQWGPGGYVQDATSSAGVPLYPGAPSVMSNNPGGLPPIISQGSQMVSPMQSTAEPAYAPAPTMVDPSYTPAATSYSPQYLSTPPVEAPVISSPVCNSCGGGCDGGCSTPVTSAMQPAPACGNCSGGGCSDCGIASNVGGAVTSNCQSCGNNGCYNANSIASKAGTSGSVSDARRYLFVDALYFTRHDGDISNSNFGSLNSFDWNGGLRVTFGAKDDSLSGREVTYMGLIPLEQSASRTDAGGRISARFGGSDGFSGAETSAFRNATEQSESKESAFHSLEFNRVTWGWDVIKSFGGLRVIYVDDSYEMNSRNLIGETGNFQMNTVNNLIGPHLGGEIFYDVGYRLSYSLMSKAGAYVNFNKIDTSLTNAGANFINGEDTNGTLSTSLELGLLAHYQLSPTARFRAGYNILWLGEVASVSDNFTTNLTPTSATQTNDSDDMTFHGLSFGLEIFR